MDQKIKNAIREAVAEARQDPGLARKLESWFEAIASGNDDINDRQASYRHLELLYNDTRVPIANRRGSLSAISLDDLIDDDQEEESA